MLYLSFIALCIILSIFWFFGREKIGHSFPNSILKRYSYTPVVLWSIWWIRICILILIIMLWINPQIHQKQEVLEYSKNHTILILDISKSMLSDDINPSRLEKAKELLEKFIKEDRASLIGYVIFAGKTFLMSPPSLDHDALSMLISETTTDTINQNLEKSSGTNVGDALLQSIYTLEKIESGQKNIILITDGRANTGIDPIIAAWRAQKANIPIYAVGIWSASGSALSYIDKTQVRQYFYDENWGKIVSDRDDITLRKITEKTGGKYFTGDNDSILEDIFHELEDHLHTPYNTKIIVKNISTYPFIVLILISLSLAHMILTSYSLKKYNSEKNLHF